MNAIVRQDGNLERLLTGLEFDIHGLVEYRIAAGWRVSLPTIGLCGICYVSGSPCRMIVSRSPPVLLPPNSVAIVPSGKSLLLEGPGERPLRTLSLSESEVAGSHGASASRPIIAGNDDHTTNVIFISFQAYWGTARELFRNVQSPIIDEFGLDDPIRETFDKVVEEYSGSQFGARVMLRALLRQIIVVLLRRSREASRPWCQQLAILQDPAINRVFSEMVARPGAQYSVATLSEKACLSRSAFMVRFVAAVGAPPFVVLRELRMRRAAELLASEAMTIDQVARAVGYGSRSSFARAFRIVYGVDVSVHRKTGVVTQPDYCRYIPAPCPGSDSAMAEVGRGVRDDSVIACTVC
jgi:AraC family transcriptional activator of mtrCDE